jgi:hypothetical protein
VTEFLQLMDQTLSVGFLSTTPVKVVFSKQSRFTHRTPGSTTSLRYTEPAVGKLDPEGQERSRRASSRSREHPTLASVRWRHHRRQVRCDNKISSGVARIHRKFIVARFNKGRNGERKESLVNDRAVRTTGLSLAAHDMLVEEQASGSYDAAFGLW